MATPKPSLTNGIWGSTGLTTDPGASKTKTGWIGEIPDANVQNWYQERVDELLFHLNEQGIAVWDADTDYPVNGWGKGSDGNVYVSLQTPNIGNDPISSPAFWLLLESSLSSRGRLVKFLTTTGTLITDSNVDTKLSSYLTSNTIKPGKYLVYAYGAGSGGNGAGLAGSGRAGGGGGGQGGVSRAIIDISSNLPYVIGAGGNGGSGDLSGTAVPGTAGGDTTISTITGNGANVSALPRAGNLGGYGDFMLGLGGGNGQYISTNSTTVYGGAGGSGQGRGVNEKLGCGGGGGSFSTGNEDGADGGDGYIEIFEWS